MEKVIVLLSTYNGEKYLEEQLDSLVRQKNVEIQILARDDGSSDRTIEILSCYSKKYDFISYYKGENIKPAKSFLELIVKAEDCPYYALCDQDDVWDEDKLFVAIQQIKKLNSEKPAMYYGNTRVVDQDLNYIRNSHQNPLVNERKYSCLVEALPTGCTMVFNLAAKKLIQKKLPQYCSMHDTWLYMVCKIFGEVCYDFEPHISYRQHGNNVIGVYKKRSVALYWKSFMRLFNRSLQPRYQNAINFLDCFQNELAGDDMAKIQEIANYKDSLSNTMKFLCDSDMKTISVYRDFRNKVLILLRNI